LRIEPTPNPSQEGKSEIRNLKFEIEDTGVGISLEQLEKIFEPFEQVDGTARRTEGTGLGLAISKQLVELMGSELRVKSEVGQGSVLWFEAAFPIVDVAAAEETSVEQRIAGYKGQRRKVLVVDDKRENRLVLCDILKPLEFDIVMAENGQEGVEKALEYQPDVILMDLVMPVMNGFGAVKRIRRVDQLKEVPVIAISASVLDADVKKSQFVGCNAFLLKPVEADQLFDLMEEFLRIEWVYEEYHAGAVDTAGEPVKGELIPPPQEELEILYELALFGSMDRIKGHAQHLREMDDRYIPFANTLDGLAKRVEDEQIVALLEPFLRDEEPHHA
jgi:CheY-like chemotaxis protein